MNNFPYHSDIETAFIAKRGKGIFLSPRDWQIITDWKDRDVPLHIVLRTLDDVFKSNADIRTLGYCSAAVERAYGDWQASQAGASKEVEPEYNCNECFDLKTIMRPMAGTWQMVETRCEECL